MKRVLSWLLAAAMAAALTLPAAALSFQDVPVNGALTDEVAKASEYGLMGGYSSSYFGYSESITRAQFAAVLMRMMGWEAESASTPSFHDVGKTHTWYAQIETVTAHDVVDAGGNFRPGDAITRAEMAEMLVRALGLKSAAKQVQSTGSGWAPFLDMPSGKEGYISVAYAIGMTNGFTKTQFGPNASATRGQAAAMLVRIYEKLHQKTDFVHGFYAISSYSQLSTASEMDAVSAGWSRMTWDGSSALLSTTSAGGNEFAIPSGYEEVTNTLETSGVALNLNVFMDASGNVAELLSTAAGRQSAVDQIINELTVSYRAIGKNPYSGVTIDFEGLRSASKADFTAFLQLLRQKMDAISGRGLMLYVCVCPVLTGSYYDGYDYAAIADLADKMIVMAYDYDARSLSGYEGSEYYKTAAPAPLDQIYISLASIVEQVSDPSRVVLGYSAKNVAWKIDANGKLLSGTPVYPDNATVWKRLNQSDTVTGWSAEYQCSYAIYTTESGERYFLWYQDDASVEKALETAKLLGITGISIWRLGNLPSYSGWNWNSLLG